MRLSGNDLLSCPFQEGAQTLCSSALMTPFEQAVRTVQFLSADAVEQAQSGHPGAPMGLAGIAVDLFTRYVRYVPEHPDWPNRDRFVLSCGHASALLYSTLFLAGYGLTLDDLRSFRQFGSKTPGHPEFGHTPGVETTTGPLGQGYANAVGLALASKMLAARLNTPTCSVIDYRVWAIASDGDMMEGIGSEAASIAGHLGLDNLIVIYDDNRITIDGGTELSFTEDVGQRHQGCGWFVQKVDGHDPEQVRGAIDRALQEKGRPSLIMARTHIAYGAPTKQDTSSAHGSPLGSKELAAAKERAGWPTTPFHVGEQARQPFESWAQSCRKVKASWDERLNSLSGAQAEAWQSLSQRVVAGDLFERLLAKVKPEADATRSSGADLEQVVAALVPSLVQGSADLAASCKTTIKGSPDVGPGRFLGRNIHYGIREHAMGAIMNGLALSGFFIPIGSTFLMFADYMRPAIRLAALMNQQVLYVFTHDSIFVGEDGPTHQPIEHLWSLRLIPNLHVVRPADGLECAAAWAHALSRKSGPTAVILSRQKLPFLERGPAFDPASIRRGAYRVADEESPELVILASGSEVHVALEARRILAAKGKRIRVVSVPCVDAFLDLPQAEQDALLGTGVRRCSLEVGVTLPWQSLTGPGGISIGIDRFGACGPAEKLAEFFGVTAETVAARLEKEI